MSGWCYWIVNLIYIPLLLIFFLTIILSLGDAKIAALANDAFFMGAASILLTWLLTIFNVIGLNFGKWLQNLGAVALFAAIAIIIFIAIGHVSVHGSANPINISTLTPHLADWRVLSLVCFAFVGLELGSVMTDEIKKPQSNIPWAILIAGLCCFLLICIMYAGYPGMY